MYDTIRKDWATLFSNVHEDGVSSKLSEKVKLRDESPHLTMGWALHKTRGSGSSQFSSKAKEYLTVKFENGERSQAKKLTLNKYRLTCAMQGIPTTGESFQDTNGFQGCR